MGYGSPKRSGLTLRPWVSSGAIGLSPSFAREARPSPYRWHLGRPGRSTWPSENVTAARSSPRRTADVLTVTAPVGSFGGSPAVRKSPRPLARIRCGMHSSRQPSMLGCRYATCKKLLHTLIHGPRCVMTGLGCPLTATPPISCPPTSPVLLADDPDILDAGRYL